ncbi:hypothetical protein ACFFKU_13745 [Kineococcus gynurae]|uniref:Ricin-type beta-trefoil lectin protein n=2 Tax=Kineococcus gynurae TaxID=452979 RepID=A0ABV5LUA9_9ACTN
MREQLEQVVRETERHGRLPSAAEVVRRGDRRRRRVRATRVAVVAAVVAGVGGPWLLAQDRSTPIVPAPPVATSPAPRFEDPAARPDLTFTTPTGRVLATLVEPGVDLIDPAAVAGPTMALWSVDPTAVPERVALRNGAQTDGRDLCLSAPVEGIVSSELCDPTASAQQFSLAVVPGGSWTLGSDLGFVALDAEGRLTTSTDPAAALPFSITGPDGARWSPLP